MASSACRLRSAPYGDARARTSSARTGRGRVTTVSVATPAAFLGGTATKRPAGSAATACHVPCAAALVHFPTSAAGVAGTPPLGFSSTWAAVTNAGWR